MLESVLNYLLNPPDRLINLGARLFHIFSALTIAGIIGRVVTTVGGVSAGMAGHKDAAVSLADIYPDFPTWWIPESALGFTFTVLFAAAGFFATRWAKKFKRIYSN